MSDRPETIEDILAEMRDLGALDEQCNDMIPRSLQALGLRTYADRFEAARKREQADPLAKPNLCRSCKHLLPDGCEICGCGDYVEAAEREHNRQYEPRCDWSIGEARALANTLANHGLRDGNADAASSCIYSLCRNLSSTGNAAALREALEKIVRIAEEWDTPGIHAVQATLYRILEAARAALAAPPRNCDRFKAADEARMAFWDTHETIWDAFKNRGGTELFYEVLDWLFAPAESSNKKEGGAK